MVKWHVADVIRAQGLHHLHEDVKKSSLLECSKWQRGGSLLCLKDDEEAHPHLQ